MKISRKNKYEEIKVKIRKNKDQEDLEFYESIAPEDMKLYERFVELLDMLPEQKRNKYIQKLIDVAEGNKPE
ncbi:hypothetical protein [Heyndrickxia oleronia]|uniref:Uncharacterized protein n=1 Tax=Heyndrickxia oleronia TaxID=38875 RepID=A0AAW6SY78_9BACI|nr:hypothetical protein [Heyndrickxia oleronia]MBU5212214.1 hypothetical protein [Heyndrickxia oleronia]MDH5161524.1 hypothetical protein [Heyndrickxia oleronia]